MSWFLQFWNDQNNIFRKGKGESEGESVYVPLLD